MKAMTIQTAQLLDMLPDEDIAIVHALVKKLVMAWDPDFTKVTAEERALLEQSDAEIKKGNYVSEKEIWS